MEIVGPTKRLFVGVGTNFSYVIGYMLMAGFGYAFRDRLYVELASLIPIIPLTFLFLWVTNPRS